MDFIVEKATELGVVPHRAASDGTHARRSRRGPSSSAGGASRAPPRSRAVSRYPSLPRRSKRTTDPRTVCGCRARSARAAAVGARSPRIALREQLPALLEGRVRASPSSSDRKAVFAHAEIEAPPASGGRGPSCPLGRAHPAHMETAGLVVLSALAYAARRAVARTRGSRPPPCSRAQRRAHRVVFFDEERHGEAARGPGSRNARFPCRRTPPGEVVVSTPRAPARQAEYLARVLG